MTSIDLLRMAENLRAKVIIPVHYDIWSNFMASTNEILELWKMRKTVCSITSIHLSGSRR